MAPRPNRKSVVWEFYTKENDKVKCKLCQSIYKHFGNTTNLITHLKRKHPIQFLERSDEYAVFPPPTTAARPQPAPAGVQAAPRPEPEPAGVQAAPLRHATGQPAATATHSGHQELNNVENEEPAPKRRQQMRLTAPSKVNQKTIDDALVDMIVVDFQPISVVENEGFQRYTKKLNPDYNLPTRQRVTIMLEEKYNLHVAAVKEKLKFVDDIALTTDIWSSDSQKSYISATAHFIQDGKMCSLVISTAELTESHNSANIANAVKIILEEWQIFNKVVSIVTDNAQSMKKAVSDYLHKRNHYCVAHTLNLCVKDCIEKSDGDGTNRTTIGTTVSTSNNDRLIQLLAKCRKIVSNFKHSPKSSTKLRDTQKQMSLPELKVKQDVATRWNSSLLMLERLQLIKVPLSATIPQLDSPPSMLDPTEWSIIEDCIALLQPFEKITGILSGDKYPTLSLIIPIIRGLQNSVKSKIPSTDVGKNLQPSLLNVIEKRLCVYESNRTAAKATFLDPRFKKKAFGIESNAANAQKWIIDELMEYSSTTQALVPITQQPAATTSRQDLDQQFDEIWGDFDKRVMDGTQQTPFCSATIIVKQYMEAPYLERNADPLKFWEEKKNVFPLLYKLACKYLCIPATSVPSERLFSKAGMVTNQKRNRLLPKKLNQILVLNSLRSF